MPDHFVTLGTASFHATEIEFGALPRTITVAANALSTEPVQVTDFTSDYLLATITGFLQGVETQDESATAHLVRLKTNLKTEVGRDSNTLAINWLGISPAETYRVFKNQDFGLVYTWNVQAALRIDFTLTLNCLP